MYMRRKVTSYDHDPDHPISVDIASLRLRNYAVTFVCRIISHLNNDIRIHMHTTIKCMYKNLIEIKTLLQLQKMSSINNIRLIGLLGVVMAFICIQTV